MIKELKVTSYKKSRSIDVVVGSAIFPFSKNKLWNKANHPYKFAPHCINLDGYSTDKVFKAGNKIEEIHNFLGWKQKYIGKVKSLVKGREWSMHTHPVGFGPFPLPHYVKYSFKDVSEDKSQMSITCEYEPGGLLSLPGARFIVKKIMGFAISKLLVVPTN
ncbi:MAG: hypothetical protein WCG97_01445 [bacterium]